MYNNGLDYGGKLRINYDHDIVIGNDNSVLMKTYRNTSKIVQRNSLDDLILPVGAIVSEIIEKVLPINCYIVMITLSIIVA